MARSRFVGGSQLPYELLDLSRNALKKFKNGRVVLMWGAG